MYYNIIAANIEILSIIENRFLLLQNVSTIYLSQADLNYKWILPKNPLVYGNNSVLTGANCQLPSNGTLHYYWNSEWYTQTIPQVYVIYDKPKDRFFLKVF